LISGCSPSHAGASGVSTIGLQDQKEPPVSSPAMARDTVLDYLRKNNASVPAPEVGWQGKDISSDNAVATDTVLYSYQDWTVSVVSPQVLPESKDFTVIVLNQQTGYKWAGLVDAYGTVLQMGPLQVTPVPPNITPLPTYTPFPTATPSSLTATPVPVPCNDASFLEDVTIPDGTTFPPGKQFLKVWRLKNVGSCTWTTDYDLVFVGGNRLGAPRAVPLAETVEPGQSVNLGVYMLAPQTAGTYRGFWMLRNAKGERFGVGDTADDSFWVEIQVTQGNVTRHKYDFALDYCDAIWRSAAGRVACGDISTPQNGSVQYLISPAFENRHENEPTIQVSPNEAPGGWIEGTFPAITIASGDHFRGWVGCMEGYELCNVTFYLAYTGGEADNNAPHTLGRWHEVYDNKVTVIDLDLSSLAGQSVQFILGMEANTANVSSAQGFWFVPRIQR
jgi:hypothetical protein